MEEKSTPTRKVDSMPEQKTGKLRAPEFITKAGAVPDITAAYIEGVLRIDENLEALSKTMEDIADSLNTFSFYLTRKGMSEGILSEEDFSGKDGGEEPDGDEVDGTN